MCAKRRARFRYGKLSPGGRRSGVVLGSLEGTGGAFVDRAGGGAVRMVSEGEREGEITIFYVLRGSIRRSGFEDKGTGLFRERKYRRED